MQERRDDDLAEAASGFLGARAATLDAWPPAGPMAIGLLAGLALSLAVLLAPWPRALRLGLVGAGGVALVAFARQGRPQVEVLAMPTPSAPASEQRIVRLPEPRQRVVPAGLWADVPGGTFLMGSPEQEEGRTESEGPQHPVTVSPFQMMRVPVTRALYVRVTGQEDPGWPEEGKELGDRPVNNVSWYDAVDFCNTLSEIEGLKPCYQRDADEIRWQRGTDGYRLPTEAEWEYACRAGSTGRFCFGDREEQLDAFAWYQANSGGEPQPVGRLQANAWGLHDLHGNVWEWCWDRFAPYAAEPATDPVGPENAPRLPVLRGGAYWDEPRGARSAYRDGNRPESRFRFIGFRCVRAPLRELGA